MANDLPLDITIKNVTNTPTIEEKIRHRAEKLPQFYNNIEFCKVVVDAPQKHKTQGKLFRTHIEIGVPGKVLVANHKLDENLYATIRDAFSAIERQLEAYAHRQRGDVKKHAVTSAGRVVRIFPDYGFIEKTDGSEFYFNADSVLHNKFEDLNEGDLVQFTEMIADDGFQAIHVNKVVE